MLLRKRDIIVVASLAVVLLMGSASQAELETWYGNGAGQSTLGTDTAGMAYTRIANNYQSANNLYAIDSAGGLDQWYLGSGDPAWTFANDNLKGWTGLIDVDGLANFGDSSSAPNAFVVIRSNGALESYYLNGAEGAGPGHPDMAGDTYTAVANNHNGQWNYYGIDQNGYLDQYYLSGTWWKNDNLLTGGYIDVSGIYDEGTTGDPLNAFVLVTSAGALESYYLNGAEVAGPGHPDLGGDTYVRVYNNPQSRWNFYAIDQDGNVDQFYLSGTWWKEDNLVTGDYVDVTSHDVLNVFGLATPEPATLAVLLLGGLLALRRRRS